MSQPSRRQRPTRKHVIGTELRNRVLGRPAPLKSEPPAEPVADAADGDVVEGIVPRFGAGCPRPHQAGRPRARRRPRGATEGTGEAAWPGVPPPFPGCSSSTLDESAGSVVRWTALPTSPRRSAWRKSAEAVPRYLSTRSDTVRPRERGPGEAGRNRTFHLLPACRRSEESLILPCPPDVTEPIHADDVYTPFGATSRTG